MHDVCQMAAGRLPGLVLYGIMATPFAPARIQRLAAHGPAPGLVLASAKGMTTFGHSS